MKTPRMAKSFMMEDQHIPIIHFDRTIPRGDDYHSVVARDALIAWEVIKRGVEPSRGKDAIDRLVQVSCIDAIEREGGDNA